MSKVVLFDFDGVLTVEPTGSTSIINYITRETGIDYDLFKKAYRRHNRELLLGIKQHKDVRDEVCLEIGQSISFDVLHESFERTELNLDMLKLARRLKSLGYRLGIITDNKSDRIQVITKRNNLNKIFEMILVSAEIGSCKNERYIFEEALRRFEVDADSCIFIDNNEDNLLVPKELGFKTVFYDYEKSDISRLVSDLKLCGISL